MTDGKEKEVKNPGENPTENDKDASELSADELKKVSGGDITFNYSQIKY